MIGRTRTVLGAGQSAAIDSMPLHGDREATPPSLQVLAGRNLLFSEAEQSVYELNDIAAYVWRSLDQGLTAEATIAELVHVGADVHHARSVVWAGLEKFAQIRLAAGSRLAS